MKIKVKFNHDDLGYPRADSDVQPKVTYDLVALLFGGLGNDEDLADFKDLLGKEEFDYGYNAINAESCGPDKVHLMTELPDDKALTVTRNQLRAMIADWEVFRRDGKPMSRSYA